MTAKVTHYPPLESVTRPTVPTEQAAYYLNRRPQTLRGHACMENGPIRPLRINGRLAWPVSELRRVLGMEGDINQVASDDVLGRKLQDSASLRARGRSTTSA